MLAYREWRVVCCSHQSHCLRYVSRSNQIAALGCVSHTNQSVVFKLVNCAHAQERVVDTMWGMALTRSLARSIGRFL